MEFDVEKISDVEWNEDAFANLVLPEDRKALLQSLVEAHHKKLGFDDFIRGKGQGLLINLYGPPGVGRLLQKMSLYVSNSNFSRKNLLR